MTCRRVIIAFSGIDGAGKTTVASRLAEELEAYGMRVRYTWCRHESPRVFGLVKIFKRISQDESSKSVDERRYLETKSRLLKTRLIGTLYRLFVVIDYAMEIHERISKKAFREEVVIIDRYVLDVAADVIADCELSEQQSQEFLATLMKLVPEPTITCVFMVPRSVSLERKDDILNEEYIDRRLSAYELLSSMVHAFVVDGTASISESTEKVRDLAGLDQNRLDSI